MKRFTASPTPGSPITVAGGVLMTTHHVTPDELEAKAFETGATIVNFLDDGVSVLRLHGVRYVAPLSEAGAA